MTQPAPAPAPVADQLEEQEAPSCQHHWVIQPATGPISSGVCQICDETREFKNYVEASTWGEDKSNNRATARANGIVSRTVSKVTDDEDDGEE